ncbi:MAG: hypothetical protein JW976_00575 [Syntrophaceae bacterium]|nr:hypothetical protein [Syntrophaceae bacterium]
MKFKILWISLIIVFFILLSICFSEEPNPNVWEYYAKRNDGGIFYYNKTNIVRTSHIVSVWTYVTPSNDYRKSQFDLYKKCDSEKAKKFKKLDHIRGWIDIDCNKKLYSTKALIDYDDKENVFNLVSANDNKWLNITPKTPILLLYEKVCVPPLKKTLKNKH